jgi:hypothetical protein
MIAPVRIGLRVLAILARMFAELAAAPVRALAEILSILSGDVLTPFVGQMANLAKQLDQEAGGQS